MKKIIYVLAILCFWSCHNSDNAEQEYINVAVPSLMSKTEFRNSVKVESPQHIEEAGKIYAYSNYVFVNDKFKGIHVIDNTNPSSPKAVAFIKILGNKDMSIKNDYLYADSSTDLVVFNISNINNIEMVERLEDVFSVYDYQIPEETVYADFGNFNFLDDIIIGWTIEQREVTSVNGGGTGIEIFDTVLGNGSASIGIGGSLARFQIVEDYLYTVASHEMTIFNIKNLSEPTFVSTEYAGNNIETLFETDGFLYIGSTDGMYIYSLENPAAPNHVSEFVHWTGCDPVIVDGDYAYLTIRSGNNCGEQESVLEIIDISDKNTPTLAASYSLDNPYGLGIKNNYLFVCDGSSGLKVFDKSNPTTVELKQTFADINAKDVIPLNNSLLMIGGNTLYQYQYNDGSIELLSTYQLN